MISKLSIPFENPLITAFEYPISIQALLGFCYFLLLDLDIDPKTAWALQHRDQFPVDLNKANKAMLLRIPGLGVTSIERIITTRNVRAIRYDDLTQLRISMKKVLPFIVLPDYQPGRSLDATDLRQRLQQSLAPQQFGLFEPI